MHLFEDIRIYLGNIYLGNGKKDFSRLFFRRKRPQFLESDDFRVSEVGYENSMNEILVLSVCIFSMVSLPSYCMKFVRFLLGREHSKIFGKQEMFYFRA